jgi:hypothetical protein
MKKDMAVAKGRVAAASSFCWRRRLWRAGGVVGAAAHVQACVGSENHFGGLLVRAWSARSATAAGGKEQPYGEKARCER